MNLSHLFEKSHVVPEVLGYKKLIFEKKIIWFKVSIVLVVLYTAIDGQLALIAGEASQDVNSAIRLGDTDKLMQMINGVENDKNKDSSSGN